MLSFCCNQIFILFLKVIRPNFLSFSGADSVDKDEEEFIWEKHLEETNSVSIPPTAFKHVRRNDCLVTNN